MNNHKVVKAIYQGLSVDRIGELSEKQSEEGKVCPQKYFLPQAIAE